MAGLIKSRLNVSIFPTNARSHAKGWKEISAHAEIYEIETECLDFPDERPEPCEGLEGSSRFCGNLKLQTRYNSRPI